MLSGLLKIFVSLVLFVVFNLWHYEMLENRIDLSYVFLSFFLSGIVLVVVLMLVWDKNRKGERENYGE